MTSAKLFRFSGIVLLLASAINLIGLVMMVLFLPDTTALAPRSSMQSPFWPVISGLNFLFFVLLLIGLPGLYLRMAGQRGDRLGLVGTVLLGVGVCLEMASSAFFVAIIPILADKAPDLIADTLKSPLAIFGLVGALCVVLGNLVLGSALIRTQVYPRWIGGLLLMFIVCVPLEIIFARGAASTVITAITHVIVTLAFGSIGLRLMKQDSARSALDVRSPVVPSI